MDASIDTQNHVHSTPCNLPADAAARAPATVPGVLSEDSVLMPSPEHRAAADFDTSTLFAAAAWRAATPAGRERPAANIFPVCSNPAALFTPAHVPNGKQAEQRHNNEQVKSAVGAPQNDIQCGSPAPYERCLLRKM